MARLLVLPKLRLLRNALRSSRGANAAFVVSTTFAVLVAAGPSPTWPYCAARARRWTWPVIFTVFAFGRLFAPLLTFGLDGALDPATLALFPLRTGPLAVGFLAASARVLDAISRRGSRSCSGGLDRGGDAWSPDRR